MKLAGEGEAVGVMLPTSNGAALTVLGLMSANRVPAMINFTVGRGQHLFCLQGRAKSRPSSHRAPSSKRRNLEKLIEQLRAQVAFVYLEDVRDSVTLLDKISAALRYEKPLAKAQAFGRAVILFTSGSEGAPKGVVLSHANMLANVAQVAARIDFGREDKVFNVLPGLPFFRADYRRRAASRLGRARLSLSLAAAFPVRPGTRLRLQCDRLVRHRHLPDGLCTDGERLRFPLDPLHRGGR